MLKCLGKNCEYYVEFAMTQNYGGGIMPVFDMPPNCHCKHPSINRTKPNKLDELGVNINILKECPKS